MLLINDSNSPKKTIDKSKLTFNFQRYFFNGKEHLQNQGGEHLLTFYWQNTDNQTIEARFSIIIQNKIAYSPLRATFGGVEFSEEVSEEDLCCFLEESITYLTPSPSPVERGIFDSNAPLSPGERLGVRLMFYPEGYLPKPQTQKLENCLFKLGFETTITEQNYEIPITQKSFYETITSTRAKQLLRKSIKKGFTFQEILKPNFSEIHAFITHSRERKNRPMTMNLLQFQNHFKIFSENFKIFSVTDSEQIIAVGVTIKINDKIVYTFYLADDEQYLKDSPTIFLLSGIYDYFQARNYTILDLGIATNQGILNEGLAHFKRNLGSNLSLKKTYSKTLKVQ